MKKIIAFSLCLIMLLSFSACGEKNDKSQDKVDLEYYAKLGQIPEVPYKLGTDCEKLEKELSDAYEEYLSDDPHNSADDNHDHNAEDTYFEVEKIDDYVFVNNGHNYYFYKKDAKKKGISYIVTFGDAFGFKMGEFIYEVKNSFPNIEFKEEEITEGKLLFDEYLSDGTVLSTEIDGVTIMFVFLEGELYASAMYKTSSWN